MLRGVAFLLMSAASLCGQAVPIAVHGGLAVANIRLNGQGPFRMLIDTGATSSSIQPQIARALHLEAEYRVVEVTAAGERSIPGGRSVRVDIGNRQEGGVEFLWGESKAFADTGIGLDGVIGESLLSRFDYLLDYHSKQLVVEAPEGPGKRIPFESVAGLVLLSAMNPEEGKMRLVLDSGASRLVLWGIQAPGVSLSFTEMVAMNGRRSVSVLHIPHLVIGGHVLSGIDATMLPRPRRQAEDGLLPASLFRSVYVSNSDRYVKLVR